VIVIAALQEAVEQCEAFFRSNPERDNPASLYICYGEALCGQNAWAHSLEALQDVSRLDDQPAQQKAKALFLQSICQENLGQHKQAKMALHQSAMVRTLERVYTCREFVL
jgi:tetratricopeptide (TPR) repeat protein